MLHRIHTAVLLETPSVVPPGFDLDAYISAGHFGFRIGSEIMLEARFGQAAAQHLYVTPLGADQALEPLDADSVRLRATVADKSELRWWLLGFGD